MAALSADLVRDDPEAYIARDRRRALATHRDLPDRVEGAGLFADISGFTPLTEALSNELGSQRGSEELTRHLGRVFHAIIDELDRRGGDVIYFSGDAVTCWIEGDDGSRATAAGLAMQDAMARVGLITTPGGVSVQLGLKVAVAVGRARRFVVGDPEIQLIDVLAGALIDELAEAEHYAQQGEVVLDPSAVRTLGDRVRLREHRLDPATGRTFSVVDQLDVEVPTAHVVEPPALDEVLVRPWLLPPVYERLREGRGELLAELRPAFPIFLRFGGIDYDDDPDAIAKLDRFVCSAQRVMAGFGGNVLQLTLGDKGAYLYGVFGSPIAHEDDAARAVATALELRDLEATTDAKDIQIGIAHGRLRSGTYGHAMRRTFVCLGDAVNLAARLMSAAPAGGVYVHEEVRRMAGDAFLWEALPDLRVKGKQGTIVAHALTGSLERASRRRTRFELPLIGRTAELARLDDALEQTLAGDGRVIGIAAEAGMGKSRLVAEFVRSARRRGLFVAFGECQSFGTNASYFVWREIWLRLLGIEEDSSPTRQRARLTSELAAVDPGLVARAPLLEPLLGIDIPETELTSGLDAKVRKASLEGLLAAYLRARCVREPLILVLEDCHWIDDLSRDLLQVLARSTNALPVLFVAAYRPAAESGGGLGIERVPDFAELALEELGPDDTSALIRTKLEQVAGPASGAAPSDELVALVTERSGGNPFYVEELITYIASRGVDLGDAVALGELELPESLHSLVLSRIDQMPEEPRRTLKVASVVGRAFEAPLLPGAYPELGELQAVTESLETLRGVDLVLLDRAAEQGYLFKHVATQEVAYESLPFSVRRMLHGRIGTYLETSEPDAIDRRLDILAFHFWRSDDDERKKLYLTRAADAARASYANEAAMRYLEQLAPLLDDAARVDVLLKLGKVLELTGNWDRAEEVAGEAGRLAAATRNIVGQGWCRVALAEVARKHGRFEKAASWLDSARESFAAAGADDGIGQVLHLAGTLAAQQGDYDTAQARYEESLAIRERLADRASMGGLFSNLGVIAEYRGDYAAARAANTRALELRTAVGDRWAIGVSLNNLGMIALHESAWEEARERFAESIRLNRDVGDSWMVAIGLNNLGNAMRGMGNLEAAAANYAASLDAYGQYDDRWALAFLFEDIGVLAAMRHDDAGAHELMGAAEQVRATIGSPRGPALDAELADALADARARLGDGAAEEALTRGRARGLEQALELALSLCRPA